MSESVVFSKFPLELSKRPIVVHVGRQFLVWVAKPLHLQFLIFLRDPGLELTETLVQCSPPSTKIRKNVSLQHGVWWIWFGVGGLGSAASAISDDSWWLKAGLKGQSGNPFEEHLGHRKNSTSWRSWSNWKIMKHTVWSNHYQLPIKHKEDCDSNLSSF